MTGGAVSRLERNLSGRFRRERSRRSRTSPAGNPLPPGEEVVLCSVPKTRNAQLAKIPFSLVIGEKEVEARGVAPRRHGGEDLKTMSLEAFEDVLRKEATPPY